jgi:hypothetical protein
MTPFGSEKVIKQQISEAELATYFVGFDLDDNGNKEYRWKELTNKIMLALHEFAFGFHEDNTTLNTETIKKINDSANAVYKIHAFQKIRDTYLNGGHLEDSVKDKYLRRGEFGELILHLLLRDFHNTIPLLSKIYFKDSYGNTVHGFDAVHIQPDSKTLWLGESKLYIDGKNGVKALVEDIKEHFQRNYLEDEFTLVSKKIKIFQNIEKKEYWLNLMDNSTKLSDKLSAINIPLLCTYTSDTFSNFNNDTLKEFIDEYEKEVRNLKIYFDSQNDHPLKSNLNIILLLFPVKCKIELVKRLHRKLSLAQQLLD